MSIFTKLPRSARLMFGEASSTFCIPVCLDNVKINKYANLDQNILNGWFKSLFHLYNKAVQ